MNREVLRIIFVFIVCFIVAVGCCILCACLFQRVEPLASAEFYEWEVPIESDLNMRSVAVRSVDVTVPDDGIVGDNVLLSSFFKSITSLPSPWLYSNGTLSYTQDGVVFTPVSGSTGYFVYRVPYSNFTVGNTYTLTTYCVGLDFLSITFTLPVQPSSGVNIAVGSRVGDLRLRVYYYANGELGITLDIWSQVTIQWFKMEVGSTFTGYVPNYRDILLDGYEQGYDVGYVEGSSTYARRVVTHTMREIESPSVNFGWNDLGISSSSELEGCVFSCLPWWFTYRNYIVVDNNFVFLRDSSTNEVVGVNIICSTGSLVGITDISDIAFPVAVITLYQYTSGFIVYGDSSFPTTTPDPALFPHVYNVDITVSLGFENWIEQMSSSAEAIGYNRGRDIGYVEGKSAGYQQGFDYGIQQAQIGTWRGMFSALISVPVSAITNFFNFEVFGLNLLNVFQTIIIASLFIFLVRLLLGKVFS